MDYKHQTLFFNAYSRNKLIEQGHLNKRFKGNGYVSVTLITEKINFATGMSEILFYITSGDSFPTEPSQIFKASSNIENGDRYWVLDGCGWAFFDRSFTFDDEPFEPIKLWRYRDLPADIKKKCDDRCNSMKYDPDGYDIDEQGNIVAYLGMKVWI